jgi:drug/metabolite transporter (DMT)-like permease
MMGKKKYFIYLHILLVLYSLSAVFSKLASVEPFLSFKFCMFYGMVFFLLALYALCWQQIIKHLPLTVAYANKAITVVWGILWGMLIFGEKLTSGKVIGAVFVICGIVLYAVSDGSAQKSKEVTEDE